MPEAFHVSAYCIWITKGILIDVQFDITLLCLKCIRYNQLTRVTTCEIAYQFLSYALEHQSPMDPGTSKPTISLSINFDLTNLSCRSVTDSPTLSLTAGLECSINLGHMLSKDNLIRSYSRPSVFFLTYWPSFSTGQLSKNCSHAFMSQICK